MRVLLLASVASCASSAVEPDPVTPAAVRPEPKVPQCMEEVERWRREPPLTPASFQRRGGFDMTPVERAIYHVELERRAAQEGVSLDEEYGRDVRQAVDEELRWRAKETKRCRAEQERLNSPNPGLAEKKWREEETKRHRARALEEWCREERLLETPSPTCSTAASPAGNGP